VEFESVNHPDKSRSWTYRQIKEIKRDKNENKIAIYQFHGDKYEFKVTGGEMAEGLYNILSIRTLPRSEFAKSRLSPLTFYNLFRTNRNDVFPAQPLQIGRFVDVIPKIPQLH